jgi:hypothetical protein
MTVKCQKQSPAPHPRRWLLALALVSTVSGCTTVSRATADVIRLAFQRPQIAPSAEQIDAIPYAQLLLRSPEISGVLVLGYDDQGRQAWMAGHEAVYYLEKNGLISGMSALGRSSSIQIKGNNPFDDLASVQNPVKLQRRYDWMPGYHYGVSVNGELRRTGTETITLPNRTLNVVRYEESLKGPGISVTNIYWADPLTGFIWKSRQYLAPDYAVEIEQLKPYLPAGS